MIPTSPCPATEAVTQDKATQRKGTSGIITRTEFLSQETKDSHISTGESTQKSREEDRKKRIWRATYKSCFHWISRNVSRAGSAAPASQIWWFGRGASGTYWQSTASDSRLFLWLKKMQLQWQKARVTPIPALQLHYNMSPCRPSAPSPVFQPLCSGPDRPGTLLWQMPPVWAPWGSHQGSWLGPEGSGGRRSPQDLSQRAMWGWLHLRTGQVTVSLLEFHHHYQETAFPLQNQTNQKKKNPLKKKNKKATRPMKLVRP